jgi:hypothetical protein
MEIQDLSDCTWISDARNYDIPLTLLKHVLISDIYNIPEYSENMNKKLSEEEENFTWREEKIY